MSKLITNLVNSTLALPLLSSLALLAAPSRGLADTVSLTESPTFLFQSGADLYVSFSIWNYAANNSGSSPYPTSVGLQLLGGQPSSGSLNQIPNSSSVYFDGYLLQGWLESAAGTVAAPFTSPDAARLNLDAASLLVSPGVMGGSETPIAVVEADAALTSTLSEQIFGPDVASRSSTAVIHLRNLGRDLQIGLDGGYSLMSAVTAPSISGEGPVTTSGITQGMQVSTVPEPGSFALLLLGMGALVAHRAKRLRETESHSE